MLKYLRLVSICLTIATSFAAGALLPSCKNGERKESVRIALASNFLAVAEDLAVVFERDTGVHVELVSGSTGKLYAQIVNGAPYDLFLAADRERPEKLRKGGKTIGNVIPYAIGSLVVIGPSFPNDAVSDWKNLKILEFKHLAIANPDIAPYGRASVEALRYSGQFIDLKGRIVQGENISQAYHFVSSGNAEIGMISRSQWMRDRAKWSGSLVIAVPTDAHEPIEQCAVLLTENQFASQFLKFLGSDKATETIRATGYNIP